MVCLLRRMLQMYDDFMQQTSDMRWRSTAVTAVAQRRYYVSASHFDKNTIKGFISVVMLVDHEHN